eukprot:8250569-Alexandrium_andersonii.AAC.1
MCIRDRTWEATRLTSPAVLSNYQTQRGTAIRTAKQTSKLASLPTLRSVSEPVVRLRRKPARST